MKRLMTAFFLLGLLATLSAGPLAAPAAGQGPEIFTKLSDAQVEGILRGEGYRYDIIDPHVFRFELSGFTVLLFNEGVDLQLYSGFTETPSLRKINDWNQNQRFSKAYLDAEGEAVIESDLNLAGGVTRANIENFIEAFRHSVDAYADFF